MSNMCPKCGHTCVNLRTNPLTCANCGSGLTPISNSKEAYLQYRNRACDLYARGAVAYGDMHGTNEILEQIKIPLHANVQICEGGAFVEAVVWVPASKFERPTSSAPTMTIISAIADAVRVPMRELVADHLLNAPKMTVSVPAFASDFPDVAQTLEHVRLPFYCCNCQRKRPTRYLTSNFGPFCADCLKELVESEKSLHAEDAFR